MLSVNLIRVSSHAHSLVPMRADGSGDEVGALLVSLAILALYVWMVVWVYRDASARGVSGSAWAFVVFLFSILGLVIYMIQRPKGNLVVCSNCSKLRPDQSWVCPHCHIRTSA